MTHCVPGASATQRVPPAALGLAGVSEWVLDTQDGERIIAWYAPAERSRPTILYFHGNGGGLVTRAERLRKYQSRGLGMLMVSYRGYSGGTGSPSEAANVADAHLAYDALVASGVDPRSIVIYGESLGTGVAIALAAERQIGGLILDAPFTSAADIGAAAYPFVPVRWFIKDAFRSDQRIGRVKAPLLVLHGEQDRIIPIAFGEKLFALASEPKQMVRFPSGGHVDLDDHGAADAVQTFLDGLSRTLHY